MIAPQEDAFVAGTPGFSDQEESGFTLVELLVAMAIFTLLIGILLTMINQSGAILQQTQNEVGSYQSARFAFNLINRTLSQSRLNVYEDYDNPSQPTAYLRKSDLHFVIDGPQGADFGQGNAIFFQAPLGQTLDETKYGDLPGMLNGVGYYLTYGKNPSLPLFLQQHARNRFQLMQFLAPAEDTKVYTTSDKTWFQTDLSKYSTVIAENVILFLCWPRLSKEEDPEGDDLTKDFNDQYRYDSRASANLSPQPRTANQQPPLVQVTLVVLDQAVANRLPNSIEPPPEITSQLDGLFKKPTEDDYTQDLATLESRLSSAHLGYRIFNSMVPLRETKWSK